VKTLSILAGEFSYRLVSVGSHAERRFLSENTFFIRNKTCSLCAYIMMGKLGTRLLNLGGRAWPMKHFLLILLVSVYLAPVKAVSVEILSSECGRNVVGEQPWPDATAECVRNGDSLFVAVAEYIDICNAHHTAGCKLLHDTLHVTIADTGEGGATCMCAYEIKLRLFDDHGKSAVLIITQKRSDGLVQQVLTQGIDVASGIQGFGNRSFCLTEGVRHEDLKATQYFLANGRACSLGRRTTNAAGMNVLILDRFPRNGPSMYQGNR